MTHLSVPSLRFSSDKQVLTGPATAFTYDVTSAPATTPISLAELKSYLKIPVSNTTDDALIILLIELVTEVAEKITRRDFITRTYNTFRSQAAFTAPSIELRRSKLLVINSIDYINNDGTPTNIPSTVFDTTVSNDFSNIFLNVNESWPEDVEDRPQSITIDFDAGYGPASTNVPAALRLALMQHAANYYENRGDCACDSESAAAAIPIQARKIYDLFKIKDIAVDLSIS